MNRDPYPGYIKPVPTEDILRAEAAEMVRLTNYEPDYAEYYTGMADGLCRAADILRRETA